MGDLPPICHRFSEKYNIKMNKDWTRGEGCRASPFLICVFINRLFSALSDCLLKEVNGTCGHNLRIMHISLQRGLDVGMAEPNLHIFYIGAGFDQDRGVGVPLRYNNDKRKKPWFSRDPRICRHLFNSFSKLKFDEKIIKKRRLFH